MTAWTFMAAVSSCKKKKKTGSGKVVSQGQLKTSKCGNIYENQSAIKSDDLSQRGTLLQVLSMAGISRSSLWQESAVCLFVGHLGIENCVCERQRWERDPRLLWSELMQIRPLLTNSPVSCCEIKQTCFT